ncbi:MAG: hypothetical protein S4CHLAM2_14690 [Chlamydiales bacterium]|nr:hypothetical protein [Chlamydiales bacterium]
MAQVALPIIDLRREPQDLLPKNYDHNDLRDSQLIFNEKVEILELQDEWARVAACEQRRFTPEKQWHSYEGWVRRSELHEKTFTPRYVIVSSPHYSYGTYLEEPIEGARPLSTHFDREQLVEEAKLFLEAPYLWGGRCSRNPDCSGLIDLLYRAQNISIPRDAHDQYLAGTPISVLEPGDPLYLAKEKRVSHVILKLSERLFMESPETGKKVRLLKEGVDIWEEGGRWHFLDRPHSYKGFPISLKSLDQLVAPNAFT